MKFGVVGWGLRKSVAKLVHQPENGHTLAALADTSEEARGRFLEEYPDATAVDKIQKLLDMDLDAIFILTPDWLHEEHAILCLEAGVPVFLEKPMAITVEGCDRILAAMQKTGTRLYAGHNMRHFPVVRKMKEFIDRGMIGNVKALWCRHFISYGGDAYFRDWHADQSRSNTLLLQKGAHDIDVMHWLCGGYSTQVTGMGGLTVYGDIEDRQKTEGEVTVEFRRVWPPSTLDKLNPTVDVEDLNMIMMKLDNGVMASYQQCHYTPDAWRNYMVIGDEGRIENFGDSAGESVIRLWDNARFGQSETGDLEYRVPSVEGTGHGGADELMIEEFLGWMAGSDDICTSPIAARMSVAAGIAGAESVRGGSAAVAVAGLDPNLAEGLPSGLSTL
jgi:predicted dehydrogenase